MARTLYDRLNEIKTKHLSPQSVTGDKVADNAIAEKHIKDGSVTKAKIADGVIGKDEIADGSVVTAKIAGNAVTTDKIANSAITPEKVADSAITAPKIADGAITTAKIANGAITRDKVADRSVGTADLVDGAVTNPKIASNAVTQGKLAANSVGSSELIAGAVGNTELSDNAVTPPKIADGAVTPVKLATAGGAPSDGQVLSYEEASSKFKYVTPAGGITRPLTPPIATDEIADQAVTGAKIKDYDVGYTQIASNSINREKIINGEVVSDKVADGAIGVTKLQGLSVTTEKIAASAVTPDKVDSVNTPTDGQVLSYELATSRYKYVTPAAGPSGITLLNSNITVYSNSDLLDVDQILDLSAWIPATATGVLVEMQHTGATTDGNDRILLVFGRRTAMDHGYSTLPLQGRYQDLYKDAIVATDSARQIRVFISRGGRFSAVNVWIKGYME